MKVSHPPFPFPCPALSFPRTLLCGILSLLLIVSSVPIHANGKKPGKPPSAKSKTETEKEVPVEESTSPDQSELEKLLSSDQESELPVEEPAQPKAPARDELEKLLASDESKNFWEDTKKLFESIPQSVEVREEPPEQYYSYKAKAPRPAPARPAPKQTTASGHQRGWPSVNPTAIPAGAKVQRVWIWQESGDCLWNIAKEYYGDPHLWPKIYEANRHLIKNPNIIFPKQQLIIPPLDRATRGG